MRIIKKRDLTNREFAEKYRGREVEIINGRIGTICGYYNPYQDDLVSSENTGVLIGFIHDKGGWGLSNRHEGTDTIFDRSFKSYYYYNFQDFKLL